MSEREEYNKLELVEIQIETEAERLERKLNELKDIVHKLDYCLQKVKERKKKSSR